MQASMADAGHEMRRSKSGIESQRYNYLEDDFRFGFGTITVLRGTVNHYEALEAAQKGIDALLQHDLMSEEGVDKIGYKLFLTLQQFKFPKKTDATSAVFGKLIAKSQSDHRFENVNDLLKHIVGVIDGTHFPMCQYSKAWADGMDETVKSYKDVDRIHMRLAERDWFRNEFWKRMLVSLIKFGHKQKMSGSVVDYFIDGPNDIKLFADHLGTTDAYRLDEFKSLILRLYIQYCVFDKIHNGNESLYKSLNLGPQSVDCFENSIHHYKELAVDMDRDANAMVGIELNRLAHVNVASMDVARKFEHLHIFSHMLHSIASDYAQMYSNKAYIKIQEEHMLNSTSKDDVDASVSDYETI